MAKVKLSGPQKEIIDVLGHIMAVSDISANVEGMQGYLDSYIKNTLTDRQRAIYQELNDCARRAQLDLANALKDGDRHHA